MRRRRGLGRAGDVCHCHGEHCLCGRRLRGRGAAGGPRRAVDGAYCPPPSASPCFPTPSPLHNMASLLHIGDATVPHMAPGRIPGRSPMHVAAINQSPAPPAPCQPPPPPLRLRGGASLIPNPPLLPSSPLHQAPPAPRPPSSYAHVTASRPRPTQAGVACPPHGNARDRGPEPRPSPVIPPK